MAAAAAAATAMAWGELNGSERSALPPGDELTESLALLFLFLAPFAFLPLFPLPPAFFLPAFLPLPLRDMGTGKGPPETPTSAAAALKSFWKYFCACVRVWRLCVWRKHSVRCAAVVGGSLLVLLQ